MRLTIPLLPEYTGYSITIDGTLYRTVRRNESDHLLVAIATPFVPNSLGAFQFTVAGALMTEQLPAHACKAVSVAALPANADNVEIGSSAVATNPGRVLQPGEAIDIAIDNTNRLWLYVISGGDGVSCLYVS